MKKFKKIIFLTIPLILKFSIKKEAKNNKIDKKENNMEGRAFYVR
jgi:hypothetical protein